MVKRFLGIQRISLFRFFQHLVSRSFNGKLFFSSRTKPFCLSTQVRDSALCFHCLCRFQLERDCPCQLSQRPFRHFSEACSHKKIATKGQSCWLFIAAANSCFACVNHRSGSLSSRCAVLLCSWWGLWHPFSLWSAKRFCTYKFCLILKYIVVSKISEAAGSALALLCSNRWCRHRGSCMRLTFRCADIKSMH